MKNILLPVFIMGAFFTSAQNIGINSAGTTPDASAGLDVDFTNKGLLVPRVALQGNTDVTTIASPATSLLVYNTNASMTNGDVGFWYYDGTEWIPMKAAASSSAPDPTLVYTTNGF